MPNEAAPDAGHVEEFCRFLLSSSKNTEQFSPDLLQEITVETELERLLVASVKAKRDVVVAGTAGSGKTHLLRRLQEALGELRCIEFGDPEPAKEKFIRVASDLTALPAEKERTLLDRPPNCVSVVLAANEGALLAAARREQGTGGSKGAAFYKAAVDYLHRIQNGERVTDQPGPAVLDAAGYDPTSDGALDKMLALPLLRLAVDQGATCSCKPPSCPRRQAWRQLEIPEVRQRVARLVGATAMEAEGFTFRVLWNLIADLALGGDCAPGDGGPPTSSWFWRLHFGSSEVSERVADMFPLEGFALPGIEGRLWYGDWHWLKEGAHLLPEARLLVSGARPSDDAGHGDVATRRFRWLKAQALYVATKNPFDQVRAIGGGGSLWARAKRHEHHEVIRELNRYMTYGLGSPGSELELWIDYATERRLDRPDGQVSLGRPQSSEFSVVRSVACANVPAGSPGIPGSRLFLRHTTSGASLPLMREALSVVASGRSFRMADRLHTEIDWLLMRFFAMVATKSPTPNRLRLALFDFRGRGFRQVDWDVHAVGPSVTLAS